MATQVSLNDGAVASAGALAIQTNGTTQAVSISTGQVATLAQNPILTSGTANGVAYLNGSKVVTTGSALVFDGSNLGLGVTPSAWNNIFKAVQINAQGALMATSASMQMGNNVYYDGAYKFIGTGYANRYYQTSGQHVWTVSTASGSAGGAITETQAMTLNANGVLALQGASTSANGVGITFPATQSASSNAKTLDDYEEGTFTPTCTLTTPGTSFTGSIVGVYTKVGNLVTVTARFTFTKGTGSGDFVLGGLPFPSNSTASYQNTGTLSLDSVGVAGKVYYIYLGPSSTAPTLLSVTQVGGVAAVASSTDFATSCGIRYVFSYQTD